MSENGTAVVRLLKYYQGIKPGETAGYSKEVCDKIVAAGIGEPVIVDDHKDGDGIRTITLVNPSDRDTRPSGPVESGAVSDRSTRAGAKGSRST